MDLGRLSNSVGQAGSVFDELSIHEDLDVLSQDILVIQKVSSQIRGTGEDSLERSPDRRPDNFLICADDVS